MIHVRIRALQVESLPTFLGHLHKSYLPLRATGGSNCLARDGGSCINPQAAQKGGKGLYAPLVAVVQCANYEVESKAWRGLESAARHCEWKRMMC